MSSTVVHCQICARPIRANAGVIAHHGYKRPRRGSGWQTRSCLGARYEPYEVSSARIPYVIGLVTKDIGDHRRALAELLATPPDTLTYEPYGTHGKFVHVPRPEPFKYDSERGAFMPHSYEQLYKSRVVGHTYAIKSGISDLKYFKERLAAWVSPGDKS
jgi:hypothetical protein